ncbi:MAG: RpiB/LacA/LacB family sugar-phosphate isomerase [Oscillospiraceae bacterium]|nr:RpiB/LacA/LacB family sugar-phosphate isomerase [Oscillospiraceae bacterium]
MKLVFCSEKIAFPLKDAVAQRLQSLGHEIVDLSLREDGSDRPYFEVGELVGKKMEQKEYDFGFVFCGSGMGVCMVANRFEGVFAACTESVRTTKMSRSINNANVLALGVNVIAPALGCEMAEAFVETKFPDSAPEGIREFLKIAFAEVQKIDHEAHQR